MKVEADTVPAGGTCRLGATAEWSAPRRPWSTPLPQGSRQGIFPGIPVIRATGQKKGEGIHTQPDALPLRHGAPWILTQVQEAGTDNPGPGAGIAAVGTPPLHRASPVQRCKYRRRAGCSPAGNCRQTRHREAGAPDARPRARPVSPRQAVQSPDTEDQRPCSHAGLVRHA